jgi:predicted acylesterase/phospholipase RssA
VEPLFNPSDAPIDIVLSSGFLAFGRQAGFLRAVEESELQVNGICGTSSGALAGALWAAGMDAQQIHSELCGQSPWSMFLPSATPWRGLLSLGRMLRRLRDWLPAQISDLPHPFGVGVMAPDGSAKLLNHGPLPELVAASCAIPWLFSPISIDNVLYRDGGAVCRTGLSGWRAIRGDVPMLLHLVERTAGAKSGHLSDAQTANAVVRTPRSGARFWNLGDTQRQMEEARALTQQVIQAWSYTGEAEHSVPTASPPHGAECSTD